MGNSLGPNNCMPNAPKGAVIKMEITAIVTNSVALATSPELPNFLAFSKATGARAAYKKQNYDLI